MREPWGQKCETQDLAGLSDRLVEGRTGEEKIGSDWFLIFSLCSQTDGGYISEIWKWSEGEFSGSLEYMWKCLRNGWEECVGAGLRGRDLGWDWKVGDSSSSVDNIRSDSSCEPQAERTELKMWRVWIIKSAYPPLSGWLHELTDQSCSFLVSFFALSRLPILAQRIWSYAVQGV